MNRSSLFHFQLEVHLQYRSKVSYQLSFLVLWDANVISRDNSSVSQEPARRIFWVFPHKMTEIYGTLADSNTDWGYGGWKMINRKILLNQNDNMFTHCYSLSRKTVNARENFWNVYCFATNQMRDETAKDNRQTVE